jgi:replication factor C subunit 3/5
MFFIDKYQDEIYKIFQSSTLDNIMKNINQYKCLTDKYLENPTFEDFKKYIKLVNTNEINFSNFQHLLFYGPEGCGKEYIVNNIIEQIYGKENSKLNDVEYTITEYSNKKTKVLIKQSNSHIIIQPNNNGFDKYLVQSIIQEYAKGEFLDIYEKKKLFKIIVIDKIDNLSYYAQASLRRTMEKYADKCKFIFISNQLSKTIEPLRSRCIPIRVKLPNKYNQLKFLLTVCMKENINLDKENISYILKNSDNNVNKILWFLQNIKYNIDDNTKCDDTLDDLISYLLKSFYKNKKLDKKKLSIAIRKARDIIYILYISNLKYNYIIRSFMKKLLDKISPDLKYKIIEESSNVSKNIQNGSRNIIHIELYILKIIKILSTL